MKIISVIPFSRGISKETLTYFTSTDASVGSIMKVPLRGKSVHALVVGIEDLADKKADLKALSFSIKKAEKLVSSKFISSKFIEAASITAEYFASTTGSVLKSIIPKQILEAAEDLDEPDNEQIPHKHHRLVIQSDDEERFAHYKSIVREEFAKNSSVFLCLPTSADVLRAKTHLEKGIGPYSFVFHNQLKKKDVVMLWNKLLKENHPVLIIGTGGFLSVPRKDLGTIIVEREGSRLYKLPTRPHVDLRIFAEYFARAVGARLVCGDTLLRVETVWRYKHDEFAELSPLKFRSITSAKQSLVDMRQAEKKDGLFKIFSPELEELIQNTKKNNERLFLFASRRGLSPLTLCADCSRVVECRRCKAPITLHSSPTERFLFCHRCGEKRAVDQKCLGCGGWRLKTLGIGAELVAEDFKKDFPNINFFRIDADNTKTHNKATAEAKKFLETTGSVLLGTEMALPYIDEMVPNTAVVSIDSMFGMPDLKVNEKVLYILLKIRSLAQKQVLIQTRNAESRIWGFAMGGNLIDFYKEEIEERRAFDYPPFTVLIKISLSGREEAVKEEMENLTHVFGDYSVQVYPAFTPHLKGKYTMHALIKIGRDRWVEPLLLEKLRSLPPQFDVSIDPESIL